MKKRQFIKDVLLTTMAAPLGMAGMAQSFKQKENVPATVLAKEEDFWLTIRNQYNAELQNSIHKGLIIAQNSNINYKNM